MPEAIDDLVDEIVGCSKGLPRRQHGRVSALFCLGLVAGSSNEIAKQYNADVCVVRNAWAGKHGTFHAAVDETRAKHLQIRDRYREGSEDDRYWVSLLIAGSCTRLGDLSDDTIYMEVSAGHALGLSTQDIRAIFNDVVERVAEANPTAIVRILRTARSLQTRHFPRRR